MTTACHFPNGPTEVGTCGKRGKSNEHVTLYANGLVYHGFLCTSHRNLLTDAIPEFGLIPVGGRTKDAKRRTAYVGESGRPFTAAMAREWLIKRGDLAGHGAGRLRQEQIDAYAATH